eukprot:Colp12_sorted_trinity150504_noHs@7435
MLFHNLAQHDGQWQDGKAQGPGVYVTPEGDVFEGQWTDNKRTGVFTITKCDGAKKTEKYNAEGKLVARKNCEDKGSKAVECWTCGGKFREDFNNPYSCRQHRGTWRSKPGVPRNMQDAPDAPGLWSCCVKEVRNSPGCEFLAHNLSH